jgi:hypothetical protein
MGSASADHSKMGFGDYTFGFIRGRIDGMEHAQFGFQKVATGGFGDHSNTWAWSQAWFNGKLYVGTGRVVDCVTLATAEVQQGLPVYPPPGDQCTPDMKDLPLRAEIWQYTPETKTWLRVFQSPQDIPIGNNDQGVPVMTARELGVRDLYVHTESDGTPVLYAAGVSANSLFGTLPEWEPDNYPPPRILRSVDGVNWQAIPQDPGTFLGDIIKNNTDINVVSYRSFQSYKGMLFATVTNLRGEGFIIASSDPAAGNDAWQRVSPSNDDLPVWDLQVFNNYLYVATGDRESEEGYGVYKTDATGPAPYTYTPIITDGAGQTVTELRSPVALSMTVHDNKLYIGTDRKTEMVRISPDDTWELVVGAPRVILPGLYVYPISGIGIYFDNVFNGHFWQMKSGHKGLHMGTWDWSVNLRGLNELNKLFTSAQGTDVMRTEDGIHWYMVSRIGFGDGLNFGGRSLEVTPFGIFLGTARPEGGLQIWVDQSVLDYNDDQIIDMSDVDVISAAIGQPASGPTDPRDLDRDGQITVLDMRKLITQCTFPNCDSLPPAALRRMNAKVAPAMLLHAEPKLTAGNQVKLDWQPSPDAVRYRVYRITNRRLIDFLPTGQFTLPGTDITTTVKAIQRGKVDYLCSGKVMSETGTCHFIGVVKGLKLDALTTNTNIGWPTPPALVGIVSGTTYQETAPTPIQSLYYVRAEDASGNLSEPTNIVGGPSKSLY